MTDPTEGVRTADRMDEQARREMDEAMRKYVRELVDIVIRWYLREPV